MITLPQLVMLTGTGRMKSFSCEVNASDDRLFRNALPNDVHLSVVEDEVEVELRLTEGARR